jgi:uncharacterized Ntn-hydrolase superfamily protein
MKILFFSVRILVFITVIFSAVNAKSQDTFSIVAIDSVTGEIGSAGASCVGSSGTYPHGAAILSDVIPGIGAIHTQAAWNPTNQQNAHNWMMSGLSPQQIIDSLVAHDAQGNPTTRQYGIVDYHGGHPRSAAFTGVNCSNYKNDTAHLNYSIQGNILMGQKILDSMQTRFLNTAGTLAERLMAALQGAKVVGADTRCTVRNTSSQSAFLRVGKMTNQPDSLYLDLWMAYPQNYSGTFPVDPIDSLQSLFYLWQTTLSVKPLPGPPSSVVKLFADADGFTVFDFTQCREYYTLKLVICDVTGRKIMSLPVRSRTVRLNFSDASAGILIYQVMKPDASIVARGKFFSFKR